MDEHSPADSQNTPQSDLAPSDAASQRAEIDAAENNAEISRHDAGGLDGGGIRGNESDESAIAEATSVSASTTDVASSGAMQKSEAELGETGEIELDDPKSVELSQEFVGRWSTLVSTTNWEKGRIISDWREALMGSEAPSAAYSDEAWSRRVGGVTPQHVGRLRRVHDRFATVYETYPGIHWSHFLAALDWDDAEMWLEGAVQSRWSVSQMRNQRWEASGGRPEDEPEVEILVASVDEDYEPLSEVGGGESGDADISNATRAVAEGPRADGPDFGDEDAGAVGTQDALEDDDDLPWDDASSTDESPFVKLPSLPVDLAEAVEQFKLSIIRHRADDWSEVRPEDVVAALDALRAFAQGQQG